MAAIGKREAWPRNFAGLRQRQHFDELAHLGGLNSFCTAAADLI
jgi:hypothetical protein